jgi:cyclopropane fatty-acyl-phospholipid synthase-like methyltransferase
MKKFIMRQITKILFVKYLVQFVRQVFFPGSKRYWDNRYSQGDNSGAGSYGRLAEFKAEILNKFVAENNIRSVIEFGCGDGNQLMLANYPYYIGVDVSPKAIEICRKLFDIKREREENCGKKFIVCQTTKVKQQNWRFH